MAKCNNCGFLTIWIPADEAFKEAPQNFRDTGYYDAGSHKGVSYLARCLVRAHDLTNEISIRRKHDQDTETLALLNTTHFDRNCESFIPWIQGFSPKEHEEIRRQEVLRSQQRMHENRSLLVALIAAGISVIGIVVGALINLYAAKIEASATRETSATQLAEQWKMTREQIDAQTSLSMNSPPHDPNREKVQDLRRDDKSTKQRSRTAAPKVAPLVE